VHLLQYTGYEKGWHMALFENVLPQEEFVSKAWLIRLMLGENQQ